VIPNPKMDAHSRVLQNAAKRGKAREAQAKRRALAAARAASSSLREACRCVSRVDTALRSVETSEDEAQCIRVEHAASTTKSAHRRCEAQARAAGSAARKGDAKGAEKAAVACVGAVREAQAAAKLAEQHAR
jgi:hypothetical protein